MSNVTATESEGPEAVSRDAVYAETYNEMRRYRDYEFTSSTWYTAVLLAILGFLVATRFGDTARSFADLLDAQWCLKVTVTGIAALVAGASSYLIWYSHRRYSHLRKWVTDSLEPNWKVESFNEDKIAFTPRHVYYLTQWLLVVLIGVFLFVPVDRPDPQGPSVRVQPAWEQHVITLITK